MCVVDCFIASTPRDLPRGRTVGRGQSNDATQGRTNMSQPKACHENVTPCASLQEWVAVAHHVAAALAAFGEAKSAPDQWHRDRAMGKVFVEIDTAEARLVRLIEREPGIRNRCRAKMVELDALTSRVRAWAATLRTEPAKVIDFPARQRCAPARPRRRAENRTRVNKNLHLVTDDAPAAC
jgi:hypothetical protein